jgi:acetate kinase
VVVLTAILVVNAGSSSLKLRVLADSDEVLSSADLPAPRGATDTKEIDKAIKSFGDSMAEVTAAGHRIVHGGDLFSGPVLIDAGVRRQLGDLTDLAPLHQPKSLAALDAVNAVLPAVPAIGCFDTAFHATIPAAAATFALPAEWRKRWGLRRFGFHGLSHAYVSRRAADLLGVATGAGASGAGASGAGASGAGLRVVSCHLGAGASLAAVRDGRSVDTTMSFTPLDGLIMATRSGSVDPGLVLWLQTHAKIPADELGDALEHRSGLYGLAGTGDMREVLSRAAAGDAGTAGTGAAGTAGTGAAGIAGTGAAGGAGAVLARDAYLHRLRGSIATMAAAMDGLDALVFTGGVGENSAEIRSRAMAGLGFLGVREDAGCNAAGTGDREIGMPDAPVRSLVIAAREDIEIARQVREVLRSSHPQH